MRNMLRENQDGIVLVSTLMMLAVLMALLGAYFMTSNIEMRATKFSRDSSLGFYAAEGGLNLRAEEIRQTFIGFNRPTGVAPVDETCETGDQGSGDFICKQYALGQFDVETYLSEDPANPILLTIPPGELYQNLNAQEYRYTVNAKARDQRGRVSALLELRFKTRLVPLFQFAAFYNKDLEILPGPKMVLEGPVHTNGDLYVQGGGNDRLDILGQVTTAGDLWRGRKNNSSCNQRSVRVADPANVLTRLLPNCSGRTQVQQDDVTPTWGPMIQMGVDSVTVPEPEVFDAEPGQVYWDKADLRLVLRLDGANNPDTSQSATGVEVRDADNSVNSGYTNALDACAGTIGESSAGAWDGKAADFRNTFYNNREGSFIQMLEVDMRALLNCIHNQSLFGFTKGLDDDSEGGIVFHFSVDGPNSDASSNSYGVRVRNAAELQATVAAPGVKGVSAISDQAFYVMGDYNKTNKIPAAIMADTFNPLSNNWGSDDTKSTQALGLRLATDTTIHSAILAGTDSTGNTEGPGGQGGAYNGGLENYPRFHENWSSKTLTYYGSFVSLGTPQHQDGAWKYGNPQYTAPNRDWWYDTDFNDAANLPPITPRFVYLRQELFVREYELE